MAESTKFLHTHTCDWCGNVIAENIEGPLDRELATKFTVERPGVKERYSCLSYPLSRTVLICRDCLRIHTVEDFAVWLERTKE